MIYNQVNYEGKKVVITGASSGMGEAVVKLITELGAEVYALDLKPTTLPVKAYIPVNLGDKTAIDAAIAQLPNGIDAVFQCAGIAGNSYSGRSFSNIDVITINYIGARYLIESIVPKLNEGSAIIAVASLGGVMWQSNMNAYDEFTNISDWDQAREYALAHINEPLFGGSNTVERPAYVVSKECLIIWALKASWDLAAKKIRLNTISPGSTRTPMHKDFLAATGAPGDSLPVSPCGFESTADNQASVMLFLNSDMAAYVSGIDIRVDYAMASIIFRGAGLMDY